MKNILPPISEEDERIVDELKAKRNDKQNAMKDEYTKGYEKAEEDIMEYLYKKVNELEYSSQAQNMKIDLLILIDSVKQRFHRANGFPHGHQSLID